MSAPSHIPLPPEVERYPSLVLLLQAGKSWQIRGLLEIYERGKEYVVLPDRVFRLNDKNEIVTETGHPSKTRVVGQAVSGEKLEETGNTLDRELVLRIAGLKDTWLQEDFSLVMRFRDMVLRCAGSKKVREALWQIRANNAVLIRKIQTNQPDSNTERDAEKFYTRCLRDLRISEEEKKLIEHFSWKWKSTFAQYPQTCNSWMIIVCIMDIIDLSR